MIAVDSEVRGKVSIIPDPDEPGSICYEVKVGEAATDCVTLAQAVDLAHYWASGNDRWLTGLDSPRCRDPQAA
jgi:hypothetical protein